MRTLVIYSSKYGHTEKYANWIAEDLGSKALNLESTSQDQINAADCIVFGAGIYVGSINFPEFIQNLSDKKLVLFIVGAADPKDTDYTDIYKKSIKEELLGKIKIYHFQAGVNYKKLSILHKMMMRFIKGKFDKELKEDSSEDFKYMMKNYFDSYDFSKREYIKELVDYVKNLS